MYKILGDPEADDKTGLLQHVIFWIGPALSHLIKFL